MSKVNFWVKPIMFLMCILCTSIIFAGCSFGAALGIPVITIQQGMLSWEKINGATSYIVYLNEDEYTTKATNFNYTSYISEGNYEIKVKAKSGGIFAKESELSNVLTVSVSTEKVSAPENFVANVEDNQVTVSWTHPTATKFTIKTVKTGTDTSQEFSVSEKSVNITSYLKGGGAFDIYVRADDVAEKTGDNVYVQKQASDFVGPQQIEIQGVLDTPTNIEVTSSKVEWDSVIGAESYNVLLLGQNQVVSTNTNSISTSSLTGFTTSKASVIYVQAVGNGVKSLDSNWSGGYLYENSIVNTTDASIVNLNLFGEEFDLYANSQEELENIFRYAIYYRLNKIPFFISYIDTTNLSTNEIIEEKKNAIEQAINAYPEIMSLSMEISMIPSTQKMVVGLLYNDPDTPTEVATGTKTVTQNQDVKPENYATTKRVSTFNDFKINDRDESMLVFTGEQLFQAVQAGYKPIFAGNSSAAKTLYDRACEILREIVNDEMSDTQKVLAIYEWICYNNVYDHNLSDRTEEIKELKLSASDTMQTQYEKELRNYRGFYMEGMLLDDGQAVCDGIAKTFALLCNMEGIECYKTNGNAKTGLSIGGHAWNKVKISSVSERWYSVDCTWGDSWTGGNNIVETLSYNSLLETDEEFCNQYLTNYHIEEWPNTDVSKFVNKQISTGSSNFDLIIDTTLELNTAIDYLTENYKCFDLKLQNSMINFVSLPSGWEYLQLGDIQSEDSTYIYTFYKKV
ncbi:MAG: hypothetical protein IJW25_00045 [Clostridia bacterium]|nr:hypothetical protein [Clostridia bacterium]